MTEKKSSLGKGLSALFGENKVDLEAVNRIPEEGSKGGKVIQLEVEIEKIAINPFQPRTDFNEKHLKELSDSIKQNGIIQPITVKPANEKGEYELISGERRLRAASIAGLKKVPVFIYRKADKEKALMLELALIENLQREDLNPMELSNAYQMFSDEFGYTQEQIAEKVSKQRSTVANFMRLQKLPPEIKMSLRKNEISEAHARMILRVDNVEAQIVLWKKILEENYTVRELDKITKQYVKHKKKSKSTSRKNEETDTERYYEEVSNTLIRFFGTKVRIVSKGDSKGEIIIEFYSEDDIDRILDKCI